MYKRVIICVFSLIVLGMGCGVNVAMNQGSDPITVFYDGLSMVTKISTGQVATILNSSLVLLTLLFDVVKLLKKVKSNEIKSKSEIISQIFSHINIGTLIYLFTLGNCIDLGIYLCNMMNIPSVTVLGVNLIQLLISLFGCLMCFAGIGGFVYVKIGLDPWTAASIIISEELNKPFKVVKIIFDTIVFIIGWLMGGTVGIITIFCALAGGPAIQKSAEIFGKVFGKVSKSDSKS